jgi:hypothetical protein
MADDFPVSDEGKALLDERFKAHSESPEDALTLEDLKKRLTERLSHLDRDRRTCQTLPDASNAS